MPRKPIKCCPHCGSTSGIYTKATYMNVRWYVGFCNETQDNREMYDNVSVRGGEMAYCQDCNKVICRMSTLRKQWEGDK